MKYELAKYLDECIARIRKGEITEACLVSYPHLRPKLEPLLQIAFSLSAIPKVSPSDEYRKISKVRVMMRCREEHVKNEATESKGTMIFGWMDGVWRFLQQNAIGLRTVAVPVTVMLLLALLASVSQLNAFEIMAPTPVLASPGTLTIYSGGVQIKYSESDSWQNADDGIIISTGSSIKTASDSHALIAFFEGSTVKIEPDTVLEIIKVEHNAENAATILLRQFVGRTWSLVTNKEGQDSRYQVETPSATVVVKGTLFATIVDERGATRVATTRGLVGVTAEGQEVNVPAGQQTKIESGLMPSEPVITPEPGSEISITIEGPVSSSITDPTGSSVGHLPSGLDYNQISGSQSLWNPDNNQVITIQEPTDGEYMIVLRCVSTGTIDFNFRATSEGVVVSQYTGSHEAVEGSEWLLHLNVEANNGLIVGSTLSDIEPLEGKGPEKLAQPLLQDNSDNPGQGGGQDNSDNPGQ
ncbi:FecR domain-containing protein, partial [Chloroflexota bacterium]